jgi:hypothetical protein
MDRTGRIIINISDGIDEADAVVRVDGGMRNESC